MNAERHSLDIDVQRVSGTFAIDFLGQFTSCYDNVNNVIVKLCPKHGSNDSLLVNCHYDSFINATGTITTATMLFLLCPGRGAEHCDQFICLCVRLSVCLSVSVCPRAYLWNWTTGLIFTKLLVQITCGRGSVLTALQYVILRYLYTTSFMYDVMLGRSGPTYYH